MTDAPALGVKIFADGADRELIEQLCHERWIAGFTTNPTLMRKAGVTDYERFARALLELAGERPVSLEVFADELAEMEAQAHAIASFGPNVYVKVPVTNTRGHSTRDVVKRLAAAGVKVNVTAVMTTEQVRRVSEWLADAPAAYVSVLAGRIADTGRDPLPIMTAALELIRPHPNVELIWASPREVLNLVQAATIGCHVITVVPELLAKLPLLGRELDEFSLETVRMFYDDGRAAGFTIDVAAGAAVR